MKKIFFVTLIVFNYINNGFADDAIVNQGTQPSVSEQQTASPSNGRALPSPLDSPPFPNSDWIGPVIGEPDSTPDYPLQKAVFGDDFKENRLKIYGWANASVNYSSSNRSNAPLSYDIVPNTPELEQFVLRIERQPDTVQTDHPDWGFRLSNLYGTDYRFTTSKGWFSDQLLKHNDLYGYDPVECYGLIYVPNVAEGMLITVGRFISPPDIEAQMATGNLLFSHSVMFTYDPYTFTGAMASIRVDPQWTTEFGVHAGNDMAPWTDSARPNGHFMERWVSKDNNDSVWAGVNSIGSGEASNDHDNLQQLVATWEHKFNDTFNIMTETYYMWQYDAPLGGTPSYGPLHSFGGGGGPGPIIPGLSNEFGIVSYFQVKLSNRDYLSLRPDLLDDFQGQRSGFKNVYTSYTLGWCHEFNDLVLIRPEVRYDRAWNTPAYDDGTRMNQITFGIDVIVRF